MTTFNNLLLYTDEDLLSSACQCFEVAVDTQPCMLKAWSAYTDFKLKIEISLNIFVRMV